jgi:apolipoprotein N-acyltransferase
MSYPADWMQTHSGELDQLENMSVSAARLEPGPIIWPETPAPFSLFERPFALRAMRIPREAAGDFIFGAVNWEPNRIGGMDPYNSAVQLDPAGREVFVYDKIHLVPFGEYVPWRRWLTFAGKLTVDIGDFSRGTQRRVGQLPGGRYAVFVCYESAFPGEVRQFTANGAELLVNISNDGWFGRDAAPAQSLEIARVRAVENRRWLLRSTNNGYTASVDPYGRIVAELPVDVRAELDAPYAFRSDTAFYVRHGEWVPLLCVIGVLLALLTVEWNFLRAWLHPPPRVPLEFEGAGETDRAAHEGPPAGKSNRRGRRNRRK